VPESEVPDPPLGPDPRAAQPKKYYQYEASDGRVHLVDSVDKLPPEARSKAAPVELPAHSPLSAGPGANPVDPSATTATVGDSVAGALKTIDATSFALGFGVAAIVLTLLYKLTEGSRFIPKLVLGLAAVALMTSLYLGYLRRTTGQSDTPLAGPAELVNDARKAVKTMEDRQAEQQRLLDEIVREAH
jgi:hypothetical protein